MKGMNHLCLWGHRVYRWELYAGGAFCRGLLATLLRTIFLFRQTEKRLQASWHGVSPEMSIQRRVLCRFRPIAPNANEDCNYVVRAQLLVPVMRRIRGLRNNSTVLLKLRIERQGKNNSTFATRDWHYWFVLYPCIGRWLIVIYGLGKVVSNFRATSSLLSSISWIVNFSPTTWRTPRKLIE